MNEMDKLAISTFVYIIEEYLERIRKAKEEIDCCYKHILVNISDLKSYLEDTKSETKQVQKYDATKILEGIENMPREEIVDWGIPKGREV